MRARIVEQELVRTLDNGQGLQKDKERAFMLGKELVHLSPRQAHILAQALALELDRDTGRLWLLLRGRERLDYKRKRELKQELLRSRVLEGY